MGMDEASSLQNKVSDQRYVRSESRRRILIVEDDCVIAMRLSLLLAKEDYEILGVKASGRDALAIAKDIQPDAILMDVRIQGDLNGIETAVIIQGYWENRVPVIFLTGMPSTGFPLLAAVEPYCYIRKPVQDEELLSTLQRALAKA